MVSAIARLKAGNLNTLSLKDLAALREAVESHPSIIGFAGCEDALERLDAAESERVTPVPDARPGNPAAGGRKRVRLVAGAAALVTLLIGIGVFASRSGRHPDKSLAGTSEIGAAAPAVETSKPFAKETVVDRAKPEPQPLPAEAKPVSDPVPASVKPAGAQRPAILVSGAGARLLDDPHGGFLLTPVNGSDEVKLTGEAPRLVVSDLNGECTLDLEDLQCPLIEFRGDINGVVKIRVKSVEADVAFRGSIDGNPHISVAVPGGKVRFFKEVHGSATLSLDVAGGEVSFAGNGAERAWIGGGVKIRVNAGTAKFSGGMEAGARADVTLDRDGILRFSRLDDDSSIHYRKAEVTDSEPTVDGDRSGSGKLVADAAAG